MLFMSYREEIDTDTQTERVDPVNQAWTETFHLYQMSSPLTPISHPEKTMGCLLGPIKCVPELGGKVTLRRAL